MKLLLMLLVVLFAVWLWRSRRPPADPTTTSDRQAQNPRGRIGTPQPMVRCHWCGLHVPRQDALVGPQEQLYCSTTHLEQARQQRP